jgi:hypothetical protein
MIRKEYQVESSNAEITNVALRDNSVKEEILKMLDIAFQQGAIVELKILEGVDLTNDGKRFSKIRMDIVSNTDFDKFII